MNMKTKLQPKDEEWMENYHATGATATNACSKMNIVALTYDIVLYFMLHHLPFEWS